MQEYCVKMLDGLRRSVADVQGANKTRNSISASKSVNLRQPQSWAYRTSSILNYRRSKPFHGAIASARTERTEGIRERFRPALAMG